MSTIDGPKRDTVQVEGPPPHILLIQAPYYEEIVGGMRAGVERVVAITLAPDEQAMFDKSVEAVNGLLAACKAIDASLV